MMFNLLYKPYENTLTIMPFSTSWYMVISYFKMSIIYTHVSGSSNAGFKFVQYWLVLSKVITYIFKSVIFIWNMGRLFHKSTTLRQRTAFLLGWYTCGLCSRPICSSKPVLHIPSHFALITWTVVKFLMWTSNNCQYSSGFIHVLVYVLIII